MGRLEIVAPRASGEVNFAVIQKKGWLLGIGVAKMVTTGRSSMHLSKASLLSRQWGPSFSDAHAGIQAAVRKEWLGLLTLTPV